VATAVEANGGVAFLAEVPWWRVSAGTPATPPIVPFWISTFPLAATALSKMLVVMGWREKSRRTARLLSDAVPPVRPVILQTISPTPVPVSVMVIVNPLPSAGFVTMYLLAWAGIERVFPLR